MEVLGGWAFLINEVPLYLQDAARYGLEIRCQGLHQRHLLPVVLRSGMDFGFEILRFELWGLGLGGLRGFRAQRLGVRGVGVRG